METCDEVLISNEAFVYILVSLKDGKRYIGSTNRLQQRIKEHNSGRVKSTKYRIPLKLVAVQRCKSLGDARVREALYKRSHNVLERALCAGEFETMISSGAFLQM